MVHKKPRLQCRGKTSKLGRRDLFLAVLTDRFDRAAFEGLHAQRDFFFRRRLLVHIRVTALVMAREKSRRRLPAKIAVDALLIDVEFTRGIIRPFVRFVGHDFGEQRVIEKGVKPASPPLGKASEK